MTTEAQPPPKPPTVVKTLTQLVANQTEPQNITRRQLPLELHQTIETAERETLRLRYPQICVGLYDDPANGKQRPLTVNPSSGGIWFTGPSSSGRTHALKIVVAETSRLYSDINIVVINTPLGETVLNPTELPATTQGPHVCSSGNLLETSVILEQLHRRYFQNEGTTETTLLVIDRVINLSRSLIDSDQAYSALQDILRDGASRQIYTAVSATDFRERLVGQTSQHIALAPPSATIIPTATTASGNDAMLYTNTGEPTATGSVNFAQKLGKPAPPKWNTQAVTEHTVQVGSRWSDHLPLMIGDSHLSIAGDKAKSHYMMEGLAFAFSRKAKRPVVQLAGPRDTNWAERTADERIADITLTPDEWNLEKIKETVDKLENMPGVLFAPNLDFNFDRIESAVKIGRFLDEQGWIIIASSKETQFRQGQMKSNRMVLYSSEIWLAPNRRKGIDAVHSKQLPGRPTQLRYPKNSAFYLSYDISDEVSLVELDPHNG